MTTDSRTATDGGDERRPEPRGGLLFALACGFIGWQFSPGSALAGFYLGWVFWKPLIDPEPSDVYVRSK
jgi:hypothetical protein